MIILQDWWDHHWSSYGCCVVLLATLPRITTDPYMVVLFCWQHFLGSPLILMGLCCFIGNTSWDHHWSSYGCVISLATLLGITTDPHMVVMFCWQHFLALSVDADVNA